MDRRNLRILLWDVDGTLLRSARATTFREYTRSVLEAVFGTVGQIDDVPLTGKTDLQFIAEALLPEGFTQAEIWERIEEIANRYLCEVERARFLEAHEQVTNLHYFLLRYNGRKAPVTIYGPPGTGGIVSALFD